MEGEPSPILSFVPLFTLGILMAIPAGMLAKEKGRSVVKWVILALIPIVNFAAIWYFIGTPDKRLGEKLDALLAQRGSVGN